MAFTQRAAVTTSPLSNDTEVFPVLPGQGFFSMKRPVYSSTIARAASGREVRLQAYAAPRWEWTVGYEAIRRKSTLFELQALYGFFGSRFGKTLPFYYQDPDDNAVSAQGFGTGDGTTTIFQLYRTVGSSTIYTFLEPVLVVQGTPTIFINGVAKTAGTDYVIGLNGVITFTTAPAAAAALTWTGSYLYLCRFDTDSLDVSQFTAYHWEHKGLTFVSVKA
jgi:uncharacterized protein (TIGR02217 family)